MALPDLADVLSVSPDSLASDPTVFHKRYLKKIRDLGEVRGGPCGLGAGPGCPGWGLEDRGQGLGCKKTLALETLSFKGGPGELKGRPRLPGAPINKEQAGPRIFQIDLPGKWAWGAGVGLTLLHTPARVTSERSACIATTPPTTALVRW